MRRDAYGDCNAPSPMPDPLRSTPRGFNFVRVFEGSVLVISVFTSLSLAIWTLWRAGFGFDFSDEGHYISWIADPWINKASVTQFSFVYHPLYRVVGGDIVLLRQANIFLTLSISWVLCFVLLRKFAFGTRTALPWWRSPYVGVSAVLSTSTLASLHFSWLPTPNYNSLALQALLLAATGILLAEAGVSRQSLFGWLLIGISGWLAFMAKPTTALALSVSIGLYLLVAGRLNSRMLIIPLVTGVCLLLVSAWSIDGTIAAFVRRLALGVEDARLLQANHTLGEALRWDDFYLSGSEKITLTSATFLVFLSTYLSLSLQQAKRACGATVALLSSLACLWMFLPGRSPQLNPGQFQGLAYWAVPFGALLGVGGMAAQGKLDSRIGQDQWALAVFFASFPYVYAFGTNSNYWVAGSRAAIFWVLAGIVLLAALHRGKTAWRIFLPAAAGTQLCTTLLLFVSAEYPYRQPQPLRLNTDSMHFAGTGSELLVPRGVAEYVDQLRQLSSSAGFKTGDSMLDLTGRYPGALYALGAKSVGRSWMIGGYPGSENLAIANLDRVDHEDLVNSWILTEPGGPRRLSAEILERYGVDLNKDYIEVGTVPAPVGEFAQSFKQHLLKPVR